jgi:HEPN domain-containing protein
MPRDADACAQEWLAVAELDLLAASNLVGNPALPRQASYCAQQAAEKAIEAILAKLNVPFPRPTICLN